MAACGCSSPPLKPKPEERPVTVPVIRSVIERGAAGGRAAGPRAAQPRLRGAAALQDSEEEKEQGFSLSSWPAYLIRGGKGSGSKAVFLSAGICLGHDNCTWPGCLPAGGGLGCRAPVSPPSRSTHPHACPRSPRATPLTSPTCGDLCVWIGTEWTCSAQGMKGRSSDVGLGLGLGFPHDSGPCWPTSLCGNKGMGW